MSSLDGAPPVGAPENPLRIAVIGSGPSGFYAVQSLLQNQEVATRVDMFDRLPTPFGLVRTGVAPDHPKIKAVATLYDKLAHRPEYRFFGNVEYGKDLTLDDLRRLYHQVVFACGAQNDRHLDIPGEELAGVHSAREFVAWYNGDPDHSHDEFDFNTKAAVVVGAGNVAADVARILCRVHDKLAVTDIADYALDALDHSKIERVYVLARRGPVQAKISPPEIRELAELVDAETSIPASDLELDELSQAELDAAGERDELRRQFNALLELRERKEPHKHRKLILRFLVSPIEILGDEDGRVRALRVSKNRLVEQPDGRISPRPTGEEETIECGLIFRSVGYKGVALPDLPFDSRDGVLPNRLGRVFDPKTDEALPGVYAVGWIKRGPTGLIGSNKACSRETVDRMLQDSSAGDRLEPAAPALGAVEALLRQRKVRYFTYADWEKIDALEVARGKEQGRPRIKITERDEFLAALGE